MTKPTTDSKRHIVRVNLWLRVERNSKFVRGIKKARQEIEDYCLSQFCMKKLRPDGWEYELTIHYGDEQELENTVHAIFCDMESIAEDRNCFTEADISEIDGERTW